MEDDMHAHTYDHEIWTASVSCSILLKQRDAVKKRIKGPQPKKGNDEAYIDNVEDYKPLKDKRVVAIVPI